jgi:DNA-binding GntR family transcriptional regulator
VGDGFVYNAFIGSMILYPFLCKYPDMSKNLALSANHRIKRTSLPLALAESLRERILNGEFKEGEALIQETIAAEYDVSRMPVREAFRELEASGLITMKVHKGAVVSSVPLEQIGELFDLRALLECKLLEAAVPQMTQENLDVSKALLVELDEAYHKRDVGRWGGLNWEFHKSLYVPANRAQTMAIVQGINLQTDRYIRLQLLLTDDIEDAEKEHHEIIRLCEKRDVSKVVPYMRKHILDAKEHLLTALSRSRGV